MAIERVLGFSCRDIPDSLSPVAKSQRQLAPIGRNTTLETG